MVTSILKKLLFFPVLLAGLVYITIWMAFDMYPQILSDSLYRYVLYSGGLTYLFARYGTAFAVVGAFSIVTGFLLKLISTGKKYS